MSVVARLFGGARTGDLHALRWESFDLPGFTFGWVPRQKTERPQKLAIVEALRPYLTRWWHSMGAPREGLVFPRLIGAGAGSAAKPESGYAKELRRDLKRAMGLEAYVAITGSWSEVVPVEQYSQRQRELFTETEHRQGGRAPECCLPLLPPNGFSESRKGEESAAHSWWRRRESTAAQRCEAERTKVRAAAAFRGRRRPSGGLLLQQAIGGGAGSRIAFGRAR